MINWMGILKVKQIVTPTTKISQRKEQKEEEDKDCCTEAWEKYAEYLWDNNMIQMYNSVEETKDDFRRFGIYGENCQRLREILYRRARSDDYSLMKIIDEWDDRERR